MGSLDRPKATSLAGGKIGQPSIKHRPNSEMPARIESTRLEDVGANLTHVVAEPFSAAECLGQGLHPATAPVSVSRITGLPERTASRVLNDSVEAGLLASVTPKTAVSLRFPDDSLEILFPRLYPQTWNEKEIPPRAPRGPRDRPRLLCQ